MSIRRRVRPCVAIRVHAPACASMCSLCCNARPHVGLLTTQFLVQCQRLVFETLSNSISCASMRWCACPLASMRVHAAPCAIIRVHALQCAPMRLLVGPIFSARNFHSTDSRRMWYEKPAHAVMSGLMAPVSGACVMRIYTAASSGSVV